MSEKTDAQRAADEAMRNATQMVVSAYSQYPSVATDFLLLASATYYDGDGDACEDFFVQWPGDGRSSYTNGLGLLERAKMRIQLELYGGGDG